MVAALRTILVVEDDGLLRSCLLRALDGAGRRILGAPDPATARELLSESPDLLILGSGQREQDGRFLRSLHHRAPACQVILISPLPREAASAARRLGASSVMAKPVDLAALRAEVTRLLD